MSKRIYVSTALILAFFMFGAAQTAAAAEIFNKPTKTVPAEKAASENAIEFAKRVAKACVPGQWEGQPCLKAVSENNLVMLANYGEALQKRKKDKAVELIKEHCSASTAATQGEFPAYAMRSAFVECANMIYDITESSGILPDQSQYQLLVGAVQCLDKTVACAGIEKGLQRYKGRR